MSIAFATNIAALRREKNISQKTAAEALGISQALLSHYEKGIRECNLEFVVKAAEYYSVSTDYLLSAVTEKDSEASSINLNDDSYDALPTSATILRSLRFLSERAENSSNEDMEFFNDFFSIAIEKYLALTLKDDIILASLCDIPFSGNQIIDNNYSDIPTCIKTIDKHAVSIIHKKVRKSV